MADEEREDIEPGEAEQLPAKDVGTDEPVEFADAERSDNFALIDRNGPPRGDGSSGGAPQWLGWFVVLAILLMMAVALILGAQRLREDQAVLAPTATPRPAIGSMRVGSPTVAAAAVAEAVAPPTEMPVGAAAGDAETVTDTQMISGTESVGDVAMLGDTETISGAQAAGEQPLAQAEPDTPEPAVAPEETAAATPQPTDTPTEEAAATATTLPSATPTALPTETLTPSPTATTLPSATPTALPTETQTPSPTATTLPTATSVLTATPRPTATRRATATAPPSGRFSAGPAEAATPQPGLENVAPGDVLAGRADAFVLHMDASAGAPVMEVYGVGALFTVLEPAGETGAYPVTAGGQEWVRVRAADGLVGWAPLSALDLP